MTPGNSDENPSTPATTLGLTDRDTQVKEEYAKGCGSVERRREDISKGHTAFVNQKVQEVKECEEQMQALTENKKKAKEKGIAVTLLGNDFKGRSTEAFLMAEKFQAKARPGGTYKLEDVFAPSMVRYIKAGAELDNVDLQEAPLSELLSVSCEGSLQTSIAAAGAKRKYVAGFAELNDLEAVDQKLRGKLETSQQKVRKTEKELEKVGALKDEAFKVTDYVKKGPFGNHND